MRGGRSPLTSDVVATHPGVFSPPLTPAQAEANVESLLRLGRVRLISEGQGFWSAYREVTRDLPLRGNLVPDAHLAALLLEHGVETLYVGARASGPAEKEKSEDAQAENSHRSRPGRAHRRSGSCRQPLPKPNQRVAVTYRIETVKPPRYIATGLIVLPDTLDESPVRIAMTPRREEKRCKKGARSGPGLTRRVSRPGAGRRRRGIGSASPGCPGSLAAGAQGTALAGAAGRAG